MTADEMIEVIREADRAGDIEFSPKGCNRWRRIDKSNLAFDFQTNDYRVSPVVTIEKRMTQAFIAYCKHHPTAQWYGWPGSVAFANVALAVLKEFEE